MRVRRTADRSSTGRTGEKRQNRRFAPNILSFVIGALTPIGRDTRMFQYRIGIFVIQDEKITYRNPSMARHLERRGTSFFNAIHPDDRRMVLDNDYRRLASEEMPAVYAVRFLEPDGSVCWMEMHAFLFPRAGEKRRSIS